VNVVFWDLREFTPATDADFFKGMAVTLGEQLTAFGPEARTYFFEPDGQTSQGVKEFFEIAGSEDRIVLLVMDGMDQPLSSEGLTRTTWDNLNGLANRKRFRFLAASRQPLRQLCNSSNGRSSNFWEQFYDPVTRLLPLKMSEVEFFLAPLAEHCGPVAAGAVKEFCNWTGGNPLLAAGLATQLVEVHGGASELTAALINSAAAEVLGEGREWLAAAWDDCDPSLQGAYAELVSLGPVAHGGSAEGHRLEASALAVRDGGHLRATCRLLEKFSGGDQASLVSLKQLFGDAVAYERNIRSVASLRWQQVTVDDADLQDFVNNALAAQKNAKVFLSTIRNIIEHSLDLLWRAESPNNSVPKFTSEFGLKFLRDFGTTIPAETHVRLRCLDLLTFGTNGVKPKKCNRRIYTLLHSLKAYGDLGQHQAGQDIAASFAATVALTAVELTHELSIAGLAAAKSCP
jgi:hypothetical protein